ncbi:MAG: translocation/assembly module TamB domain-containing protein [Acidobacteria bacterium]|nr:translocation/assembly module TamB domain-containing protein [Acidobacteriota bacterium]
MTRGGRIALYAGLAAVALLAAAGIAGWVTLRSQWFREQVRQRIVAEVERASGGRAELESFDFDWKTLRAEVRGLVLHGTEPAGARPLLRVASVAVGLRIVSMLRRDIDLASLSVERPEVNILVGPDGHTNFPGPKTPGRRDVVAEVLKLAVGEFSLRDGWLDFDSRRLRLDLNGRRLSARFVYQPAPRYRGEITARELRIGAAAARPVAIDLDATAVLEPNRVEFPRIRVASARSSVTLTGAVEDFKAPRVGFKVDAAVSMAEAVAILRLPLERQGEARIAGQGRFTNAGQWSFDGRLDAKSLAVNRAGVRVANIRATAAVAAGPKGIALRDLEAFALGGDFRGGAEWSGYRRLSVDGSIRDLEVTSLAQARAEALPVPWNGRVSGAVKLTAGLTPEFAGNARFEGDLAVTPEDGPHPIQGALALSYDQRSGVLQFSGSRLETPATRVEFSGAPGERLRVDLRTTDLAELSLPAALPVALDCGSASFRGTVTGPLEAPRVQGRATLENLVFEKRKFERLSGEIDLTRSRLRVESLAVERDGARVDGRVEAALTDWAFADTRSLTASLNIRGADLGRLAKEAALNVALAGRLTGEVQLSGTLAKPDLTARLEVSRLELAGESFDRAQARLRYRGETLEVTQAVLESGKARLNLAGSYAHDPAEPRTGTLSFEVKTDRWALGSLRAVQNLAKGLEGQATVDVSGALKLVRGDASLAEINGKARVAEIAYEKRSAGSLALDLATRGERLAVTVAGALRGAELRGAGEWKLTGDAPGEARIEWAPLRLSALNRLAAPQRDVPFDGTIQGQWVVSGPLRKPEKLLAEIRLSTLELRPRARDRDIPEAAKDLYLRNAAPVVLAVDAQGAHVRSARFVGRDTSLDVSGTFSFRSKNPWNLEIRGGLDLALFSSLIPELTTSGRAVVNAIVRGDLEQPLFGGRMELQNASVFLSDVPSGIENANGTLLFDRNRATIERLTAQAGGGQLRLSGFVGIGGPELIYRLQAEAEKVRVRYPEGVSTTLSGSLNFTGTSTRSLLSGAAVIERAAFVPRTDLGSLLAESVKPVSTPVPTSPVLTGMQFDLRVTSSPTLEVQTSLAKNLQAEADIRLRGSAAKPVVLGRVAVTQGEIQFFGNRYTISRGDIAFFNPARIEPVLNLDLETRVRAVVVNLIFSGPMSKLNMSYRSDPPLQSQEIIALLAVGRAPGSNPTQAGAQYSSAQGGLPSGAQSLIGQAISTPISGRLQRFFGVSRLKIDPHLTGSEVTPQARLTVEQQISRDITLTYVTNLAEAQEQLVRLEWNLNRQWSVVAVRDENGTFGIDFLYKKRFR